MEEVRWEVAGEKVAGWGGGSDESGESLGWARGEGMGDG